MRRCLPMKRSLLRVALLCSLLPAPAAWAATPDVLAALDAYAKRQADVGHALWQQPELGYLETASSALLQRELREAGFQVKAGVAGMPTAFVASYGTRGKGPVIALLAEMDALPGMAQAAEPVRSAIAGQDAGQACGHNLFGAASVGAARAIAQWLEATGRDGEVRLYGTPAEEGGSGKVYMTKAGLFDDVDVVLHWHPSADNSAAQGTTLANISGKFRFSGIAAHAAIAPERGRSALDGVEAHPLRDQQRWRRPQRGAGRGRSLLLRAPHRSGGSTRCDRAPAQGRRGRGDGYRHHGEFRADRRRVLAAAQ